jgi:hypothetical protein
MSKNSLKEKLKKKRQELTERGQGSGVLYMKEGTLRVRLLPLADKDELAIEVISFYLGDKIKGVYSAATLGEPCPIMEAYEQLRESKDEADQDIAKKLAPKNSYLIPVLVYEDDKGKKVDQEKSGRLLKISSGIYQSIIDHYLDEDEWGDMTDPKEGYDIKITRTGKGKTDTEYSLSPCKNTPLDKSWAKKKFEISELTKKLIDPYDVAKKKLDEFLGLDDEDEEEEKPKKKKVNKKSDFDDTPSSKNQKKKVVKKKTKK